MQVLFQRKDNSRLWGSSRHAVSWARVLVVCGKGVDVGGGRARFNCTTAA